MLRQFELVERVRSYDPNVDEEGLDRAYVFAVKMHGSQKRASKRHHRPKSKESEPRKERTR